jgi:hypothetical protein
MSEVVDPLAVTAGSIATPNPGPGTRGFAITPSNTTVFAHAINHIWVGGVGDLAVMLAGDTVAVTFSAVPAGTMLHICATKVMATGTTATLLVGLY